MNYAPVLDRYSTAETAKEIRKTLKTNYPGQKFAVKSKTYSGGCSIDVKWVDGPTINEVGGLLNIFKSAYFDSSIDLKTDRGAVEYEGKQVRFSCDYLFTQREYSAATYGNALKTVREMYDLQTDPIVSENLEGIASLDSSFEIDRELNSKGLRQEIGYYINQELRKVSFCQKAEDSRDGAPIVGLRIVENKAKEGIELYFAAKPSDAVLGILRTYGFRPKKQGSTWYWYAKQTEERWVLAKRLSDPSTPTGAMVASPPPSGNTSRAENLRKLAEGMQKRIDHCFDSNRLANTHRRQNIANRMRKEGQQLEKTQTLLYRLAEAHETGQPLRHAANITYKSQAELVTNIASLYDLSAAEIKYYGAEHWHLYNDENLEKIFTRDSYDDWRKDFKRMGVNNVAQLKDLLSEAKQLIGMATPSPQQQREGDIKKLTDALLGKKIDGYFPTPNPVIDRMIELAEVREDDICLEPSAGKGNIADRLVPSVKRVDCCERSHTLREILELKDHNLVGDDFWTYAANTGEIYSLIMMNPPFEKEQDISHVLLAYGLLVPGGRLVAVMSAGTFSRETGKAPEFRELLDELGAYVEDLPQGSFAKGEVPTGVNCKLVVMHKPF
jgi:hypothetical protein